MVSRALEAADCQTRTNFEGSKIVLEARGPSPYYVSVAQAKRAPQEIQLRDGVPLLYNDGRREKKKEG